MLTLLLGAGVMLVFFVWGFFVARARGRSGFMWGLACALTLFIGLAILYSLGDRTQPPVFEPREAALDRPVISDRAEVAALKAAAGLAEPAGPTRANDEIETGESAEDRRWRYFSEYHPEVRKALAAVEPLGEEALFELKAAHLAIGETAVLPAIVQRLQERFGRPARRPALNGASRDSATRDAATRESVARKPERQVAAAATAPLDAGDDDEPLALGAPVTEGSKPLNGSAASPASSGTPAAAAAMAQKAHASETEDDVLETGVPPLSSLAASEDTTDAPAADADADLLLAATSPQRDDPANPPAGSIDKALERTTVTPADLTGAKYLETHAGVHLFGLADGRVFIDRHEARPNLELARSYVNEVTHRRSSAPA